MTDGDSFDDGSALLRAILARPADDTPRLIFADWLEERGDSARADLIRAQCELSFAAYCPCDPGGRMPNGAACECRWCELRRRQTDLMAVGGCSWVPNGWLATANPECLEGATSVGICLFIRGFIDTVVCPADRWLADADVIIATQPVITRVTLTTWRAAEHVERLTYRDPMTRHARVKVRPGAPWVEIPFVNAMPADYARVLQAAWRGITFTLPPPTAAGQTEWRLNPSLEVRDDPRVIDGHNRVPFPAEITVHVDGYFDPS